MSKFPDGMRPDFGSLNDFGVVKPKDLSPENTAAVDDFTASLEQAQSVKPFVRNPGLLPDSDSMANLEWFKDEKLNPQDQSAAEDFARSMDLSQGLNEANLNLPKIDFRHLVGAVEKGFKSAVFSEADVAEFLKLMQLAPKPADDTEVTELLKSLGPFLLRRSRHEKPMQCQLNDRGQCPPAWA